MQWSKFKKGLGIGPSTLNYAKYLLKILPKTSSISWPTDLWLNWSISIYFFPCVLILTMTSQLLKLMKWSKTKQKKTISQERNMSFLWNIEKSNCSSKTELWKVIIFRESNLYTNYIYQRKIHNLNFGKKE